MEESKVTRDQMVSDTRGFIQDIDLTTQHIFGLFARVVQWFRWAGLDLVEAGGQVTR